MTGLKITPAGIALIKHFEQCRLASYPDPVDIWTIGYGHTGPDVVAGLVITQEHADELLLHDLEYVDTRVAHLCPSSTPEQHSAMVSLAFNVGVGNFSHSSVLQLHNAELFDQAARAFSLWNKAGGKILDGLIARRSAESSLYVSKASEGVVAA